MKTRKDLDGSSKDIETHRTSQRGLEIFLLFLEREDVGRIRRRGGLE